MRAVFGQLSFRIGGEEEIMLFGFRVRPEHS